MELYQLRSFSMVAKLGQLTKAAERLHISQPALSARSRRSRMSSASRYSSASRAACS
jgi:DNA-binding transcriptional LysR family regulator